MYQVNLDSDNRRRVEVHKVLLAGSHDFLGSTEPQPEPELGASRRLGLLRPFGQFIHVGPDLSRTPYSAEDNAKIVQAVLDGSPAVWLEDVRLPNGQRLRFEVRFGAAAISPRMPRPPPTGIIQVNLNTGNTRIVELVATGEPSSGRASARPAMVATYQDGRLVGFRRAEADEKEEDEDETEDEPALVSPYDKAVARLAASGEGGAPPRHSSLATSIFNVPATLNYTSAQGGEGAPPVPIKVLVRDCRPRLAANRLSMFEHGFTLVKQKTKLKTSTFYKAATSTEHKRRIETKYFREMEDVIKSVTGAHQVTTRRSLRRCARR